MHFYAAGYVLTNVTTLKLQLNCRGPDRPASPCPIPCKFGFTRFRITSACVLHNLIIYSYTYVILKITCKSRTAVSPSRFAIARNTVFCKRCILQEVRLSAAHPPKRGRDYVTSDVIKDL
jgi:hypothetical protein